MTVTFRNARLSTRRPSAPDAGPTRATRMMPTLCWMCREPIIYIPLAIGWCHVTGFHEHKARP